VFPEAERRLVHASGAVVPGLYVADVLTWPQLQAVVVAGSVVTLGLEIVRLWIGLEWELFDRLTREYEQDNVAGYALYVFGGTATALLFPPAPAVAALFMLAIGDPISGILGTGEFRQVKQPYVLLVMFGVCTLLGRAFVPALPAVLGGAAATVADGAKPVVRGHVVDDNLTIPLFAGAVMAGALAYL
jgi:dolichol kinase